MTTVPPDIDPDDAIDQALIATGIGRKHSVVIPSQDVSKGDRVTVVSDNVLDRRYSNPTRVTGDVDQIDRDPETADTITLRVRGDDREIRVTANGNTYVRKLGEKAVSKVGYVHKDRTLVLDTA